MATGPSPADRVREEGASPGLVRGVALLSDRYPVLGPVAGFWTSVYTRFGRHRGTVLAGGLAFFGLLSVVPAVISMAALAALVVDPVVLAEQLREAAVDHPERQVLVDVLTGQLDSVSATSVGALGVAGLVSIAIALYAASRFVYVGGQVLDIAFGLAHKPPTLVAKVAAVAITLLAQLVMAAALVLLGLVPRVLDLLGMGALYSMTARYLRLPVAVVVVYLLLTVAMRYGTRTRRRVRWLNPGALVGTVIVLAGTFGLGWYLTRSGTYSQIISVLGGVVALELWLYLVGLAIVLAAETEAIRLRDLGRADPAEAAATAT